MKLVTRWTKAAGALEYLRNNYQAFNLTEFRAGMLCGKLEDLGPDPHPDRVDAVMGSDVLTDVGWCRCCRKKAEEVVELWEDPRGYPIVCAKCLLAAMQLIEP